MDSIKFAQFGGRSPDCQWVQAAMMAYSAISANQAKKKASGLLNAPNNRSYLGEMQSALDSQAGIQGQLLDLESQYTPRYQELQKETLMGQMGTLNDLYGQAIPQSMELQSQYAQAQAPVYGQVGQMASQAYQQTLDPTTQKLAALQQQSAMEDLTAGRNLTPQQQQLAQQSARQAMAARGLSGNQAVAQEVLNSYQMQDARENRARQYANTVYQGGLQHASNAMSLYGSPLLANMNTVSPYGIMTQSQQMQQGLGARIFNPESQYNADIYGANQSNTAQSRMALANIYAGQSAGQTSMMGQLGSAYLSNPNNMSSSPSSSSAGSFGAGSMTASSYLGQYGMGYSSGMGTGVMK
jgi:hypothetical protein